jgi:hypothetical protein
MSRLFAQTRFLTAGLAAAALVGASGVLAQSDTSSQPDLEAGTTAKPLTKGEKRLAKLLEGREAGKPVSCIRTTPTQRVETIEGAAYVYGQGNTIWVQRTTAPEQIDDTDALIVNRFSGSQLCRFDITTTVDRFNGLFTGAVFFEDFVPYTRVQSEPSEG